MRNIYTADTRKIRRQKLRDIKRKRMKRDLSRYGGRILHSAEMRQAFRQKHHTLSTVGEHTLRVARMSLSICYALRRLHISTDIPAVVTGSLCHDLGILGRSEKYSSVMECSRQHPVDSLKIARKLMGKVPKKTTDIISRHMWPVGRSKPPNSLEAVIVITADKISSVKDFVEGYRKTRPGIRGVLRELVNWTKEWSLWKTKKE